MQQEIRGISADISDESISSATMRGGASPTWQRLGEVDLVICDDEEMLATLRNEVHAALIQSVAGFGMMDELHDPLENAVLDAMVRKSTGRSGGLGQRLIISCLNPPAASDASLTLSGWSFFVIERPANHAGSAVEVIELCLYHE